MIFTGIETKMFPLYLIGLLLQELLMISAWHSGDLSNWWRESQEILLVT